MMRRFFTFISVLLIAASLVFPAYADGSVTYYNNADEFVFAPGTTESVTSLFADFRNVMPGDVIEDSILVSHQGRKNVRAKIYLRSLGAQDGSEDFLSQMKLTVVQKGDSTLFEAPADKTAQLTDWVCLGTFYSGADTTLELQLEVPKEMSNDFAGRIGYLDWEFMVEEIPINYGDDPRTGDSSNIFLYSGIMLISLASCIILFVLLRRKKQND